MTVGGLAVDPTDYLDADAMASLGEDTNYEDESSRLGRFAAANAT